MWSALEPCLGIISGCLPVLQPALAKLLGENPFEWTRKSMSSLPSCKTSTVISFPSCCAKTDTGSQVWPTLPAANRTQSCNTNKTWPQSNERRVVRFKDVDWGDYFPQRVNTIPMSRFYYPGVQRRLAPSGGKSRPYRSDGSISPRSVRNTPTWERHSNEHSPSEDSGDSSQYWE